MQYKMSEGIESFRKINKLEAVVFPLFIESALVQIDLVSSTESSVAGSPK